MLLEQYLSLLIQWLQDLKQKNHVKGYIVGLSGGIDSAVTAFLLQKAVGKDCLAVIMPCESDPQDAQDARLVARSCNISTIEMDLTPTYLQWKNDFNLLQHILSSMFLRWHSKFESPVADGYPLRTCDSTQLLGDWH